MMKDRHIAIILAAGKGSRMNSDVPKQYMQLLGKPVIYYAIKCFQDSFIDDIILVTSDIEYCRSEIVDKYSFDKVRNIVAGGKERYNSVYAGLKSAGGLYDSANERFYVYIHDGARACIDESVLLECRNNVKLYSACIPAVAVKDTIKIADEEGFIGATPDRNMLMAVQTPQTFEYSLIMNAYEQLENAISGGETGNITDDAMVAERYTNTRIKLCQGSYSNIKITTPDDIIMAEKLLKARKIGTF